MTDLPQPTPPERPERARRAEGLAAVLADLNRCEHGRHEGDVCSGCGGPSRGNPIPELAAAAARRLADNPRVPAVALRQIGYDIRAEPITIPERTEAHEPDPWRPRQRDRRRVFEADPTVPFAHVLRVQPSATQPGAVAVECTCRQLDLAAVALEHLAGLVDEHLHPTDPEALPATPGLRRPGPAEPVPPARPLPAEPAPGRAMPGRGAPDRTLPTGDTQVLTADDVAALPPPDDAPAG